LNIENSHVERTHAKKKQLESKNQKNPLNGNFEEFTDNRREKKALENTRKTSHYA